jgi:septal ring factor EnvC (AmiA/AmiB activator)
MKQKDRISVLFVRDATGESWSLRIPVTLFRFLTVALVALVILGGFAVTWLGAISIRLQAADVVAQQNAEYKAQLEKVSQLEDEMNRLAEQQRRILNLTQAFVDDAPTETQAEKTSNQGIFGPEARKVFLAEIESRQKQEYARRVTMADRVHPQNLIAPTALWAKIQGQGGWSASPSERLYHVPPDQNVRAPGDGVVTATGWDPANGLFLEILLGGGYTVHLGRLGEMDAKPGDVVRPGTYLGKTGRGSGDTPPQLSVLLKLDGVAIDPSIAMMR